MTLGPGRHEQPCGDDHSSSRGYSRGCSVHPCRTRITARASANGDRPTARNERATNAAAYADQRPPRAEDPAPFVSLATDLLTVIGRDGSFQRLAPVFPHAFGYAEADLLNQHPADRASTNAALAKLSRGEPTLVSSSASHTAGAERNCVGTASRGRR